jgi:DNA-binding beta-propeller fold protein YncE
MKKRFQLIGSEKGNEMKKSVGLLLLMVALLMLPIGCAKNLSPSSPALTTQASTQPTPSGPTTLTLALMNQWTETAGVQFNNAAGIAIDTTGNIYVVDTGNLQVFKYKADGTYLGPFAQYSGSGSLFAQPFDIALDPSGNVYVTDASNDNVIIMNPSGTVTNKFSPGANNGGILNSPMGIAIGTDGSVYISDYSLVRKYSAGLSIVSTWGNSGPTNGIFSIPLGMTVDSNNFLYIANANHDQIVKLNTLDGTYSTLGSTGSAVGQLSFPTDVRLDTGGVVVVDSGNNRIMAFNQSSNNNVVVNPNGSQSVGLNSPTGLAIDAKGYLYITDSGNGRVVKCGLQ